MQARGPRSSDVLRWVVYLYWFLAVPVTAVLGLIIVALHRRGRAADGGMLAFVEHPGQHAGTAASAHRPRAAQRSDKAARAAIVIPLVLAGRGDKVIEQRQTMIFAALGSIALPWLR